jgi:hypothetical protein
MFDKKVIDSILADGGHAYNIDKIKYDVLPSKFVNIDEWPEKTNLKCWACDCHFHTRPLAVPTSMDPSDDPDLPFKSMDVEGNYCSINCAAYDIEARHSRDKWERHDMLKMMYHVMTGDTVQDIVPSPHKSVMEQYGGSKTMDAYQKNLIMLNVEYEQLLSHNSIDNITINSDEPIDQFNGL